jgi:hypothetical protein
MCGGLRVGTYPAAERRLSAGDGGSDCTCWALMISKRRSEMLLNSGIVEHNQLFF